jgi:hypothetical protein
MAATMSRRSRDEYLLKMRGRYARMEAKRARGALLDEFCEVTGHERKYATKLLGGRRDPGSGGRGRGRPPRYGDAEREVIAAIWRACEQPCGKRLRSAIKEWLPHYERREGRLSPRLRANVLAISPAAIDRLLAPAKVSGGGKARLAPKANAAVKAVIAVRAESWDVAGPGWMEADTVALCGGSMSGDFGWALTGTDVGTGWTEARATWNRGQYGVCERFVEIESALPFALLGVDTDNGGEFLNWHLVAHFADREVAIEQTRSRPYHKNDQAYVEQKNYTHVRALLGYGRLGHRELVEPLNGLLAYWSLWNNLYSPTMRQIERRREKGGRVVRRHEKTPKTPCERLLEAGCQRGVAAKLRAARRAMDPFEAKEIIEAWLGWIWELAADLDVAQAAGDDPAELAAARPCPWRRYAQPGAWASAPSGRSEKPEPNPKNQSKTVPKKRSRKPAA